MVKLTAGIFNFVDYLLVPTLVYEVSYPRKDKFRILYFIERVLACFMTVGIMYFIFEHWITPICEELHNQGFIDSLLALLIPFVYIF